MNILRDPRLRRDLNQSAPPGFWFAVLVPFALVLVLQFALAASAPAQEATLSTEAFARLDPFEATQLQRGDRTFAQKNWRQAAAEYAAFAQEFPNSTATPYVLFRRARALHQDGKRFEAIKQYMQVVEEHPDPPQFAAASLFQVGQSHVDNGDTDKAIAVWSKLADQPALAKQPVAAATVYRLAELLEPKDAARAQKYFQQVAMDFRNGNPDVARKAIEQAIPFFVRTKPDEPALRSFYEKVRSFEHNPAKLPDDLTQDRLYWQRVREQVRRLGDFKPEQKDERARYYKYWASVMQGKRADDDDFQIDLADFHRIANGDTNAWTQRLDQIFKASQKPEDYDRVVKWIALFAADRKKVEEYYGRLNFDKMAIGDLINLYLIANDQIKNREMARSVFAKIPLKQLTDEQKTQQLLHHLHNRDDKLYADTCAAFDDQELGKYRLMHFHHSRNENDKGVQIAQQIQSDPRFAQDVLYRKGEMLQRMNKFDDAITAYRAADNPPANLFRISECLTAQGKIDAAVAQLREIENFFRPQAPSAALRIAHFYKNSNQKDRYVAALRGVLAKYPESSESRNAHLELEAMGITKLGGGQDAQ